ncbi:MAG: Fic family protein [Bacilli bacterium]|nr:Fic family protein [Bacilli bacterium]
MIKHSVRYFLNKKARAVWDNESNTWWYSSYDIVLILTESTNPRIYWNALKRRHPELLAFCRQLKLYADDGKQYLSDVINENGINKLRFVIHSSKSQNFNEWINGGLDPIDEQSKRKAYELYKTNLINDKEVGKTIALQKIHAYLFEGLYEFAGQIRTKTISKDGFVFANGDFLPKILPTIDAMPEKTFDQIVEKYVEMNIAHPFMEGNGRATRIWLDLIFIKNLKKCVDWSNIDKEDYFNAMKESHLKDNKIKKLLKNALTNQINNRELFMKGIDTSYYYEEI